MSTTNLPSRSEKEIIRAKELLSEHMFNKHFFRLDQFKMMKGAKITDNYKTRNLRQSYYAECTFDRTNFEEAGLSGSAFIKTNFIDCNLNFTNMQSCDFRNCEIAMNNNEMLSTRFNRSIFQEVRFSDCELKSVAFTDSVFNNSKFENCIWRSVALENVEFNDSILSDVKLKNLNFEYARFNNIKMNNIRFPFPTIPYIFGGISYFMRTTDNTVISSAKSATGSISISEYLNLLDDLETFYLGTNNYFPLVNIYLAKNKNVEAYAAVVSGIDVAIQLRSFRVLKYYCLQVRMNNLFDDNDKKKLYNYILELISKQDLTESDYYNLNMYMSDIRYLLLNNYDNATLQISLQTNISVHETDKLALMLNIIEEFTNIIPSGDTQYFVEIRHNSPYSFFINIISNPTEIIVLAGLCYSAFMGILKVIEKINLIRMSHQEIKLKKQEVLLNNKDIRLKDIEIEKAEKESMRLFDKLNKNNIEINLVNHNITNIKGCGEIKNGSIYK